MLVVVDVDVDGLLDVDVAALILIFMNGARTITTAKSTIFTAFPTTLTAKEAFHLFDDCVTFITP